MKGIAMNLGDKTAQMLVPKIIEETPTLANAPEERVQAKAKKVVGVMIAGMLAALLLAGGAWWDYLFIHLATEQKTPISLGLMFNLLIPMIPGFVIMLFAALRYDSEAGGALTQVINFISAVKAAIKS